jgi:hypothetical protein
MTNETNNAPALTAEQIRVLEAFAVYTGNFRCTNTQARDLAEACAAALRALGLEGKE